VVNTGICVVITGICVVDTGMLLYLDTESVARVFQATDLQTTHTHPE